MAEVITAIEQVTVDWLGQVLGQTVIRFDTELARGGREGYKWRIRATCADGTIYPLFLKSGSVHEAKFYRAMRGEPGDFPIVQCYDTAIDGNRAHILLRDLSDSHEARPPSQLPPVGFECEAIIDGLADFHAHWWDNPNLDSVFGISIDSEKARKYYETEVTIYPQFAEFLGDRLPEKRREIYERVAPQLPDLMSARYEKGDLTLAFEDVHSGNFLYPRKGHGRLYFIDWEQWNVTMAMNDLAYMMALFWSAERRSRLEVPYLKRYHARITTKGVDYTWDALWDDYRLCVMAYLFRPAWQAQKGNSPTDVWWNHYERITAAYEDLGCDAMLK